MKHVPTKECLSFFTSLSTVSYISFTVYSGTVSSAVENGSFAAVEGGAAGDGVSWCRCGGHKNGWETLVVKECKQSYDFHWFAKFDFDLEDIHTKNLFKIPDQLLRL